MLKNKWVRRILAGILCVFILGVGLDLCLRWVSGSAWLRNWAQTKATEALGREVRIGKMSASFLGVKLDGVQISEAGGFEKGEILSVARLRLRFALLHLLHKHIKLRGLQVDGLTARIVQDKQGKLNIQDWLGTSSLETEPADSTEGKPVNLTLLWATLRNWNLIFVDEATGATWAAKDANLSLHRFAFDERFSVRFDAIFSHAQGDKMHRIPLNFKGNVFLAAGNYEKGYVDLSVLTVQYFDAQLKAKLRVDSFVNPRIKLDTHLTQFTSQMLEPFGLQLPDFVLDQASLKTQAQFNPTAQKITVDALGVEIPGLTVDAKGKLQYKKVPTYEFTAQVAADLEEFASLIPQYTAKYKLAGNLKAEAVSSDKNLKATVDVQDFTGFIKQGGRFEKVNAQFALDEAMDFKTGEASGQVEGTLNGKKLNGQFTIKQTLDLIKVDLKALAENVILPPAKKNQVHEEEFVQDTTLEPVAQTAWPLPPINVNADVKMTAVLVPYFQGTDIALKADLQGLTPDLKGAQGNLALSMGDGRILDLYQLTNANPLTKVIFLSLNVVGKVFNSLNVFSVLSSVGSGVASAMGGGKEEEVEMMTINGPDGQPRQIPVVPNPPKMKGQMEFDKFSTAITFKDGVADISHGSFVSDTMSFSIDGTTDFNTGKLKMTVQAAPGKHEADGVMPLRVNIGGTVADPQGSMSLLGSVSSMVTQGIGNNFVSRGVKKGLGGFFGLFKKKDKTEDLSETPSEK